MGDFVTPEGVQIETIEEIETSIGSELKAEIDPLVGVGETQVLGMILQIFASSKREDQEAIQELATALDPSKAEGAILDGLLYLRGHKREVAKPTRAKGSRRLTCVLENGCTLEEGVARAASTPDPALTFVCTKTVTNNTGITDTFFVEFEAEQLGPIPAVAGTVTTILTPTTGWLSVTNALDLIVGSDVEKDAVFLARSDRQLAMAGSSTAPALEAALLALEDEDERNPILSAKVLENKTDATDANGLPPHSFEALIWDGPGAEAVDADVAAIVKANRPAGIPSYGSVVADGERFSRASQILVTATFTIRTLPGYVGNDAVKEAISTASQTLQAPVTINLQDGVVSWSEYGDVVQDLPGVKRVDSIVWSLAGGSPVTNGNLYPTLRQVATFQTANITVNSSPA